MTYDNEIGAAQDSTAGKKMITAFFDERGDAERAVQKLEADGVASHDIKLVEGQRGEDTDRQTGHDEKGFLETVKDWFMPDEDRESYTEGLRRGGFVLRVDTDPGRRDRVIDILNDEGTVNMDEREANWRSEGWAGHQGRSTAGDGGETIEVAEEKLRVGKRDIDHGRVRVRSYVVEDEVSEDVSLRQEHVDVDRRSVDRAVASGDDAFQDQTVELEETAEEAVVSKEARVTEEIDVSHDVDERTETVSDTVRHTEVEVDDERSRKDRSSDPKTSHGSSPSR